MKTKNVKNVNSNELPLEDRIAEMRAQVAKAKARLKRVRQEKLLVNLQVELDAVEAAIAQESQVSLDDVKTVELPVYDQDYVDYDAIDRDILAARANNNSDLAYGGDW